MAVESRVAVVSGANKGVGLACVRNLALDYPKSPLRSGPLLIYLTARSPERGAEAVKILNEDEQLKKANSLALNGGYATIKYHELDISKSQSIRQLRDFLKHEHPDGIDFVINNAGIRLRGIALQGFNADIVKETLATNYYGSLEATVELLPLLRRNGRLVNVCSHVGRLNKYTDEIHAAFRQAAQTDVAAVTALMQKFQAAVDRDELDQSGFTAQAYAASKTGEIAFTMVIAMEEAKRGQGILVNACCPGFVNTDMTRGNGVKTTDEGARTPVMLALEDIGGRTGELWKNERVVEW